MRRAKPSRPMIVVLAGLLVFAAVGSVAWAVEGDVVGPRVRAAKSLTFKPDEGGLENAVPHNLFKIGQSTVFAICANIPETDPDPDAGGIAWALAVMTGPNGAIVANNLGPIEQPPNAGTEILAGSVGPGEADGGIGFFAVFDGGGASASGTASFWADDPNDRCLVTAQAAG